MKRTRRLLGALTASLLAMLGLVGMAGPADAAHVRCGDVITRSVTLDSDVGPCPDFGLHVAASGITVNLNGHRIFGANGPEEAAGIHLMNVSGVTVINGTVEGFDAGVAVDGGSGNTIRNLLVRNNINDLSDDPAREECVWGDGITTNSSDNNRILGNRVTNNGPYSGISLVEDSDGNLVQGNVVFNNNAPNIVGFTPEGRPIAGPCGAPFSRPYQDIGIRIEGPGANNNRVAANTVTNNMLNGITIHGHVCNPPPPPPGMPPRPPDNPNTNNTIAANNVQSNGYGDPRDPGAGISILRQGPLTVVCVAFSNTIVGNNSSMNAEDGIFVGAPTRDNTINRNVVNRNTRDGIRVSGPPTRDGQPVIDPTTGQPFPGAVNNVLFKNQGTGNLEHDGHDDNANCDNNRWKNNKFGTVNQPCVANRGGKGAVGWGSGGNDSWEQSNHPRR